VLGPPGDPTGHEIRPCEYVTVPDATYPGQADYFALITLEDGDLEKLRETGRLWLRMCGQEVPWAIYAIGQEEGEGT
jgi:hypothetical protein